MAEAKNMKTTRCQQEKDNTTDPRTVADEDDIATIIRMLKTWQADDNFARRTGSQTEPPGTAWLSATR